MAHNSFLECITIVINFFFLFPFFLYLSELTIMSLAELLLLSLFAYTAAIPLRKFYSFGPDAGDVLIHDNVTIPFGDDQLTVTNDTICNLSERCLL